MQRSIKPYEYNKLSLNIAPPGLMVNIDTYHIYIYTYKCTSTIFLQQLSAKCVQYVLMRRLPSLLNLLLSSRSGTV